MTTAEFLQRMDEEEAEADRVAAVVVAACSIVITIVWCALIAEVLL